LLSLICVHLNRTEIGSGRKGGLHYYPIIPVDTQKARATEFQRCELKKMNHRNNKPLIVSTIFSLTISCFIPVNAFADVVWPAIYVADSHSHFWYVVIIGLLLEAGIFRWRLIPSMTKSLWVSFVANAVSATIGIWVLVFGMLGWHIVVDNFVRGTFAELNKIATILIMMLGSTFIEMLVAKAIWKYPIRQTLSVFIIGNILSYSVVVADLYFYGGWNRSY